jgi:hypothetical protein
MRMALFDKRSPAEKLLDAYNKLSEEDKKEFHSHLEEKVEDVEKAEDEREIDKVEEEKADTEEVKDEKAEEVAEESEEIGKDVKEGETEETAEEEKEPEEEGEIEKAEEDVEEAKDNKIDALVEEFNIYKEKVDKLFAKLDELEEPEQSVGLGKQRSVEEAESDEDLSAYEYAMKHARY